MMLKEDLRKIYKQKRMTLSQDEVIFLSEKIIENFLKFFNPQKRQNIHLFLPIKKFKEIDTQSLIKYCFENQINVFVPKMIGEDLISIQLYPETLLLENSWGILEPQSQIDYKVLDFDFIITPLLYCDVNGNRIGYGKGFYDRFFSMLPKTTLKIGVNYFPPKDDISDVNTFDIPLDYLVTPDDVLSFSGVS